MARLASHGLRLGLAAAEAEMKEALRLSPRDAIVLNCAARLSEALGHWDEAIRQLHSSIARDPLILDKQYSLRVYARREDRRSGSDGA